MRTLTKSIPSAILAAALLCAAPIANASPAAGPADDLIDSLNDFVDAVEVLIDWVTPGPKPDLNNNGK